MQGHSAICLKSRPEVKSTLPARVLRQICVVRISTTENPEMTHLGTSFHQKVIHPIAIDTHLGRVEPQNCLILTLWISRKDYRQLRHKEGQLHQLATREPC